VEPNDCKKNKRRQSTVALHRRDQVGPHHHVLSFDCHEPLQAQAGQFAMIRGMGWGDSPLVPRPMSLLTAGERPSMLVKVVGEATRRLACAQPGEMFSLHAPLGRPWSRCPPDRVPVLVAGGVGVCPLLFLARSLLAAKRKPIALYGGCRSLDLPLHEQMAQTSQLRIATEDGSLGQRGFVTSLLETELREHSGLVRVYACGPGRMLARVVEICSGAGAQCEVSLETMMGCGYGVCLGCAVPRAGGGYLYACSDGPCVDGTLVDWGR
jgi:dihydroorotate dehydrogenase electron transfer subunit